MILTDAAQNIIFANEAVEIVTGFRQAEMLGRNCRFLQGQETNPSAIAEMNRCIASQETFRGLVLNYRKNGEAFWNDLTITPIFGSNGATTHFISVQRDSSELVALRESLRIQLENAQKEAETAQLLLDVARLLGNYSERSDATNAIADAIRTTCGADRSAIALWDAASEQFSVTAQAGWPAHLPSPAADFDLVSGALPQVSALVESGHPTMFSAAPSSARRQLLKQFGCVDVAAVPISSRGEFRGILLAFWETSATMHLESPFEERFTGLGHLAAVALDNAALLEQAVWNGTHDTLTGLPDRALFEMVLHEKLEAAATSFEGVAVLYLDIDRFKRANDTLGHHAGDDVLRYVASALQGSIRDCDFVARVGGDEFVIVLSRVHVADLADQVATRIREHLRKPLHISGQELFVSVSIGSATSDILDPGLSLNRKARVLTAAADGAMYRDKAARSGSPDQASQPRELSIDAALRGAVIREELMAYFQPQLTLASNSVGDVEALARWHHPQLGDVSPAEFIPLAEKNGVIHEIGAEMLRQALALGAAAVAAGTPVNVAVNVSVIQLMQHDFLDTVTTILDASDLAAEKVTIEMTESLSITDMRHIITRLLELRRMGMGVSLDDFGAGNTSVLQLYDLPLTELKIDQSFIRNGGPTGEALIQGIVNLAHAVGVTVITEGIETTDQLHTIRQLGSDRVQGYQIAPPMEHRDLLAWLNEHDRGPRCG